MNATLRISKRRHTKAQNHRGSCLAQSKGPKNQGRGTLTMQICDAMKFLRIAAVPVISIIIGVPAFVSARAQAKQSTAPAAAAPSPVAALHGAGPKRLCRCAGRMESDECCGRFDQYGRTTRRNHQLRRCIPRAQRSVSIGTEGPRRLRLCRCPPRQSLLTSSPCLSSSEQSLTGKSGCTD